MNSLVVSRICCSRININREDDHTVCTDQTCVNLKICDEKRLYMVWLKTLGEIVHNRDKPGMRVVYQGALVHQRLLVSSEVARSQDYEPLGADIGLFSMLTEQDTYNEEERQASIAKSRFSAKDYSDHMALWHCSRCINMLWNHVRVHVRDLCTHGNCLPVLSLFISCIIKVCIFPFFKAINIILMLVESGATVSCLMADDLGSSGVFAVAVVVKNDLGPSENTHESNGVKRSHTLVRGRGSSPFRCYWKNTLLNGLLFDFSLLQESASTRKDMKDEVEKLFPDLRQVQHELKMKTTQLDDMLIRYEKLEFCLSDTRSALLASKTCLQHAEETMNALSYQNDELRSLLEDLYHNKSETEEKLKEQKEIVKSLEKEIDCEASSVQEQILFSLEGITYDLNRASSERYRLCEQVNSLQEKLEMAYTRGKKMYAEQNDEKIKILENSVEELDNAINVLEKRVNEMEEELQRQHKIRDSLEVELQSLSQRLLTVESFRDCMDSNNSNLDQYEKLQEQIKDLEYERAEQANEYISELVIHAEAQALQYQQKSLEAMVSLMKTGPSKSSLEAQLLEKSEKSLVRGRGSSPFRCIANLVQKMNTEKDQELSLAKARLHELESVASSRQKRNAQVHAALSLSDIAVASKLFVAINPDQVLHFDRMYTL
uniref:Uncharacterized protein n=1 Tax=Lactuca sativa TaxID=4236 RepID=A0A9R1WXZ2_LACSA|nr:hypothetical protein LSAT_V11C800410910 [Lactuca sativa]